MISTHVNPRTFYPEFRTSLWKEIDGSITALGTNVVIDTLPLSDFVNMKYILSFVGATQDDVRYLELYVQQNASGIKEVVTGKTGPLKMGIDTNINGSSFELLVTNPENFSVDYVLTVLTI